MVRSRRSFLCTTLGVAVLPLLGLSPPALAQGKPSAATPAASGNKKEHRLILQVNTKDPAVMNLVLNNAANAEQYYKGIGEQIHIEIVTFGPGLNMLREDTSPVKERIKSMAETSRIDLVILPATTPGLT